MIEAGEEIRLRHSLFNRLRENTVKLTLGKKLGLGFGTILTLMVSSAIFIYSKASALRETQTIVTEVRVPTVEACKDLQRELNQTQSKGRQVILAGNNQANREAGKKAFDASWDEIGRAVGRLDVLASKWSLQENRDRLVDTKLQLAALRPVQEAIMQESASGDRDAVIRAGEDFVGKATAHTEAIKQPLGDMANSISVLNKASTEEMNMQTRSMNLTLILTTVVAFAVGIFVAAFLSRAISRASQAVLHRAEAIAAGDLTHSDLPIPSRDELGDLTGAINRMSGNLKGMILSITENAVRVASASEELNTTSQQITANSEETHAQADVVSKAAQAVSQNLQTVASGAEEMGASIREIAKNATEAARVATGAVKVAENTTVTVSKLGDSSTEIGQVLKVITSIAQQTNLLALNATIEAARAGEAGKGFAVVANEVKELAKETAKATEDIGHKIEAIQSDTKAAVEAIASISGVIHQINDISGTIATAVEEQNATTNEMSRNVSEAAQGSNEITGNIHGVAEAAQSTTQGATATQKATEQLVETSNELRRLVEQFKINDSEASTRTQSMAARAGGSH